MDSHNNNEICPRCGSTNVAAIRWGLQKLSDGLREGLDSGRIVLGGCFRTGDDPTNVCNECKCGFRRYVVEKPLTWKDALEIAKSAFPLISDDPSTILEDETQFVFELTNSSVDDLGWLEKVTVDKARRNAADTRWNPDVGYDRSDYYLPVSDEPPGEERCKVCDVILTGQTVCRYFDKDEWGEWKFVRAEHEGACLGSSAKQQC